MCYLHVRYGLLHVRGLLWHKHWAPCGLRADSLMLLRVLGILRHPSLHSRAESAFRATCMQHEAQG